MLGWAIAVYREPKKSFVDATHLLHSCSYIENLSPFSYLFPSVHYVEHRTIPENIFSPNF